MLLIALLIPFCIGFIWFKLLSNNTPVKTAAYFLYLILGMGLGMGVCSYLYFICLWLFGTPLLGILLELILVTGLILYRKKWTVYFTSIKTTSKNLRIVQLICVIVFLIGFVNVFCNFLVVSLQSPHGQWDAVAVWNVKARFLYMGGPNWKGVFSPLIPFTHPDYPLLLPGFIANCWTLMKTNATSAAIAVSAFFALGTAAVLFLSLSVFKGIFQGFIAGLLILSTPFFISHGASQYADVTLGFFFLATFICLTIADDAGTYSRFFFLTAGLFAGFAAWTKNEGILFLLAILFSRVVMIIVKASKMNKKDLSYFVVGSLPVIILLLLYKHFLTPANDIVAGQHGHTLDKLLNFSRYKIIFSHFWKIGLSFGQWATKPHGWLLVFLLLFGFQVKKNLQWGIICSAIAFALTFIGYFFIYVTTPFDLEWHLGSSLDRLLLQLFPSFLFLYFIVLKRLDTCLLATIIKEKKVIASAPVQKLVKKKR